jgi:hypothetical protein
MQGVAGAEPTAETTAPPAPDSAADLPAAPATPAVSGPSPAPAPTAGEPDSPTLEIGIQARAACWIRITGGSTEQDFILQPGETFVNRYAHPVTLLLGNAGGVALRLNGRPARPLGLSGEVKELTLSPANWRDFVAAAEER